MSIHQRLFRYFRGEAGIFHLLQLSLPMMISQASSSLMLFTDRYLLAPLGKEYPAASMDGGFSSIMLTIFFMGLLTYINPLVSQYIGARKSERCFGVLVQGVLFCLIIFPVILALGKYMIPFYFHWMGIPKLQFDLAMKYFYIVNAGSIIAMMNTAISSFFTGIGRTSAVMWVNIFGTLCNIPLNLYLIKNGIAGNYSGIEGAALATISSYGIMVGLYGFLLMDKRVRGQYIKLAQLKLFDRPTLSKLMKFGGPTGAEFFLIFVAFNTFVGLFHSYGANEASAMTIAFNWDIVAFLPLWGLNIGLMSLVGRYMGSNQVDMAIKATWSGAKIAIGLTIFFALLFFSFTDPLIQMFLPDDLGNDYAQIMHLSRYMLRLVSIYCFANAVNMVFTATLRAAGDTRWCMVCSLVTNWSMLALAYLTIKVFAWTPLTSWLIFVSTVFLESCLFFLRYQKGRWQSLKLINYAFF